LRSGEEAAFNAEAWHFPMEMRAWFSEDMEDDLHTAGVTNELVTSWARKEARAWNESHMPEQRNCLRSHRKAILEFMEALARVTGLSVPGWQVAILLWDAFCRTGIFASKSDLEALKELPAAVAALVLLLRKDECSCTAPRAAELAHFTTRFYRRFFARSTSATEDTNGEGPQEPVPSVMAEQIHQQERQLLEALDWQMHRPCAATWIDTLCKRLNIITSKKFTQQVQWVCQQSVATSQALVHLMPSSFEMQPKQMANGLICLMCVIARILPLEVLRSTKVSSSEWQKLFCDALSSGLPSSELADDKLPWFLQCLTAATCCSREVLQADSLKLAQMMKLIKPNAPKAQSAEPVKAKEMSSRTVRI